MWTLKIWSDRGKFSWLTACRASVGLGYGLNCLHQLWFGNRPWGRLTIRNFTDTATSNRLCLHVTYVLEAISFTAVVLVLVLYSLPNPKKIPLLFCKIWSFYLDFDSECFITLIHWEECMLTTSISYWKWHRNHDRITPISVKCYTV